MLIMFNSISAYRPYYTWGWRNIMPLLLRDVWHIDSWWKPTPLVIISIKESLILSPNYLVILFCYFELQFFSFLYQLREAAT